jgi:hypothetical protein
MLEFGMLEKARGSKKRDEDLPHPSRVLLVCAQVVTEAF